MRILLAIHRATTCFIVVFTLYLSVTGVLTLLVDLHSVLTHVPKSDPNVRAIWEESNGPSNFRVMSPPDYTAAPLPAASDFGKMLARVMQSARADAPNTTIRYVELRMLDGHPVGQLGTPGKILRFDALTGTQLFSGTPRSGASGQPKPIRTRLKYFHRMTFGSEGKDINTPGLIIDVVVVCGLAVLFVTGILVFLSMWKSRARTGRFKPFWKSGGWWRSLHRAVSIIAVVFLANLILSGSWLAVESLYHGLYLVRITHHGAIPLEKTVRGESIDVSSPLQDVELPAMLRTTLAAGQSAAPAEPIKVIRLRYFAGMPQGVIVTGMGENTRQLVFNSVTGKHVGITEPSYPDTGYPFGWHAHEIAKSIHRGDFYGLTGSMMALVAGLSVLYLSLSGIILYYGKWKQRRSVGKSSLLWV